MDVKPTRSELMKVKNQIKLAKSGYNLLKKKRDGLILDFFEILKKAKDIRKSLVDSYVTALDMINRARVLESDLKIRSIALAIRDKPSIELETKNIMGVVVPKIKSDSLQKSFFERGYGVYTSSSVDEATAAYEIVVEKIITAAEVETAMKKLLQEIEKTKRRVNALEFNVIPKLVAQKAFITLRLEEMERENTFRMKRIKAKS
ncbi:V-type ATP synthase subunit D [Candidatus Woesearchaeota archaeon]|nr:V-type ATP synthase subunit D [Candidatus Woesearchaeota archaeon]